MKNKKAMIASLMLVGAVCVGSTLAYLTDKSNTLTNSFTVGDGYVEDPDLKQAVWVDEYDLDQTPETETIKVDGKDVTISKTYTVDGTLRTLTGNTYGDEDNSLQSGSIVVKDPVIRLTRDSVESWVYMQIVYQKGEPFEFVRETDEGTDVKNNDLAKVIDRRKWTIVSDSTAKNPGDADGEATGLTTVVVRYNTMFNSAKNPNGSEISNVVNNTEPLFDKISITDEVSSANDSITNIVIKACAVQAAYTNNGTKVYMYAHDDQTPGVDKAEAPTFE